MRSLLVLPRLALGLLVSLLAGVLVAALALPLVGGAALATKSQVDGFLELPQELIDADPPTRSKVLAADGSLLATLYLENRVNVPLTSVPSHVRQAVLAIEDARFYEHNGVDTKGTLRAAVRNTRAGGVTQGGSTLTQQYVKNALLTSAQDAAGQEAARAISIERKLQEARYALALERRLTKDEILNRYLNIAYFGNGAYGIAAAAQYYFGRQVQDLSVTQGAMLAGMVQNPSRFDPTDEAKLPAVRARRNTVLKRMYDLGMIGRQALGNGSATPIKLTIKTVGRECDDAAVAQRSAGFYCDYVLRELERTDVGKALGGTPEERGLRLRGGGLTIRTHLSRPAMRAAVEALRERAPAEDLGDVKVRAAVDVVEPGTGEIKAMAVNVPYGEKKGQEKVNYAIGGTYGYQPGSTFKAFVLAAALKKGIDPSLTFASPQTYTSPVFKNVQDGVAEDYEVENASDSEAGTFDLRQATALSVNTYYVQLLERVTPEAAAEVAEALGLRRVRDSKGGTNVKFDRYGSLVLGSNEVSPLAMAGAYAAFAARGLHCTPQAVASITDRAGRPVPVPKPACTQALDPEVADGVNDLLRGVISGPGPRTGGDAEIGRPAAGKTGTTNNSRAAWFVGYTPQLATAVWVGTPDKELGRPQPMQRVTIGGRYYRQVYGGTVPAAVWRLTMSELMRDKPVVDFDPPQAPQPGGEGDGPPAEVPDLRNLTLDEARARLSEAGFSMTVGREVPASYVDPGTVAYSAPRRQSQANTGSTVTVFVARD